MDYSGRNKNLTQHEARALGFEYNLADAHTHQGQCKTQEQIIKSLPVLFFAAEKTKQTTLDRLVIEAFHRLSNQYTALDIGTSLICYSASIAMEIVANFLRLNKLSVALIEPTFDNIADILKRHQINLEVIDDGFWDTADFDQVIGSLQSDAIFLTLPNNPTGTFMCHDRFRDLIRLCTKYKKVFLLDTCFRLFEAEFCYDQYAILEQEQIDYIIIEDTGKLWPTLDLKIGFLNSSKLFHASLRDIHSDFLLNVSPFISQLLLKYFEDSKTDNFESIRGLIKQNREFLRTQLQGTFLAPEYYNSRVSVEFLKINKQLKANELKSYLEKFGIMVLPGNYFYWHQPERGDYFIRVALARDQDIFQKAVLSLALVIKNMM